MTIDKKSPEQARASPAPKPQPLRLNPRFLEGVNVRFEDGGERLVWERIDIVDQKIPDALPDVDDDESEEPVQDRIENRPRTGGQVSIMLILQTATLVVAVIALLVAF